MGSIRLSHRDFGSLDLTAIGFSLELKDSFEHVDLKIRSDRRVAVGDASPMSIGRTFPAQIGISRENKVSTLPDWTDAQPFQRHDSFESG